MKRFLLGVCCVLMVLLCGCNKVGQGEREEQKFSQVEQIQIPYGEQGIIERLVQMLPTGILWVEEGRNITGNQPVYQVLFCNYDDSAKIQNLFEINTYNILSIGVSTTAEGSMIITAVCEDSDGIQICDFDDNGNRIRTLSVQVDLSEGMISHIAKKENGSYYFLWGYTLCRIDDEKEEMPVEILKGVNNYYIFKDDIIYAQLTNRIICRLNQQDQCENEIEVSEICLPSNNGEMYTMDAKGIYLFHESVSKFVQCIQFNYMEGQTNGIQQVVYEDGIYHIWKRNYEVDSRAFLIESIKVDTNSSQPYVYTINGTKEEIVIYSTEGSIGEDLIGGSLLTDFNRTNDQYYVRVEAGDRERMVTALMGQSSPDLLLEIENSQLSRYESSGLIVDLLPFIEEDESFPELIPEVYDLYADKGKLYALPQYIYFSTYMLPKGQWDNGNSWTTHDFIEWLQQYPNIERSKESVLDICILGNMEQYVDIQNGIAHFDEKEFKNLLHDINDLPLKAVKYEDLRFDNEYDISNGYLKEKYLHVPMNIVMEENEIGEEVVFVGYPNDMGKKVNICEYSVTLSLTANGKCKEGAMEFLKFYLNYPQYCENKEDYYRTDDRMYVVKSLFDSAMKRASSTRIAKYEVEVEGVDGVYYETCLETFDAENQELTQYYEDLDAEIFQVEDRHIATFLEECSAIHRYSYLEREIRNIIHEDAIPYLEGVKSLDDVCSSIQNRSTIVLSELK